MQPFFHFSFTQNETAIALLQLSQTFSTSLHFLSHDGSLVISRTFNLGICFSEALDEHRNPSLQTKDIQITQYLKAKIENLKTQKLET